jgi:aspartate-semialdehyde dehydrogenase
LKTVAVLGATGMMGQTFVRLLANHPWFQVESVAASDRSVGLPYAEAISSTTANSIDSRVRDLSVVEPRPKVMDDSDIVFSALPADVAGPIEEEFARAGIPVFSNASSHRMDPKVPLLNPEVNSGHISMISDQKRQKKWDGFIVTNPNCTTAILTLSLKPLQDNFGLEKIIMSSMQAVSGAGYPGVASLDILENVIPFIKNEEEKVQLETNKILGSADLPAKITVSASCHRVPTINGHLEAIFVKTISPATPQEVILAMKNFQSTPQKLKLPTAPANPIVVREEEDRPQTRLDVDEGKGMTVTTGRVRQEPVLGGLKYIALGHNLVRGGAGCSILNAELLLSEKIIE